MPLSHAEARRKVDLEMAAGIEVAVTEHIAARYDTHIDDEHLFDVVLNKLLDYEPHELALARDVIARAERVAAWVGSNGVTLQGMGAGTRFSDLRHALRRYQEAIR